MSSISMHSYSQTMQHRKLMKGSRFRRRCQIQSLLTMPSRIASDLLHLLSSTIGPFGPLPTISGREFLAFLYLKQTKKPSNTLKPSVRQGIIPKAVSFRTISTEKMKLKTRLLISTNLRIIIMVYLSLLYQALQTLPG